MKYISHLDLIRLFKRSMRKCSLPLRYSEGFNPHPKMGFAQPLSLGYEGENELLEFELTKIIGCDEIMAALNSCMPTGILIKDVTDFPEGIKSLAAATTGATYEIIYPLGTEIDIEAFLGQREITVMKPAKKTRELKPVDIRSKIKSLSRDEISGNILKAVLDAGSASNLSPELLIEALAGFAENTPRERISVKRLSIHIG